MAASKLEDAVSDQQKEKPLYQVNRRAFLKGGTLFLAGSALLPGRSLLAAGDDKPKVRVGMVTDLHFADKEPLGTRYYRDGLPKLAAAARDFAEKKPDFVIELGDFIDSGASLDDEKGHLKRITKEFLSLPGPHHYALGNHCVDNLTKPEFLEIVGQKSSYYSFDVNGHHFVVLDACFTSKGLPYGRKNSQWTDANIPAAEIDWLKADLRQTPNKTVVFLHQRLDVEPPYGVKNAPEIRKILFESGKVLAVLQGHYHKGDLKEIDGIHYCTLKAMIEGHGLENNAFAVMDILPGDAIRITGFGQQKSYKW
jgi:alkaline phosphatase